jgi:hypothetical protein
LAKLRQRPSQEKVRSTTQRLGNTSKPLAVSERLTISVSRPGKSFLLGVAKLRSLITSIGEELLEKRKFSKQGSEDENAAVSVLNVGRMHDGVQQQA